MLERSISWFIFHVGNLKLLGRLNGLSTCAMLTPLMIMYDYVITLLKALQLATTNDWVGHGPPGPPC